MKKVKLKQFFKNLKRDYADISVLGADLLPCNLFALLKLFYEIDSVVDKYCYNVRNPTKTGVVIKGKFIPIFGIPDEKNNIILPAFESDRVYTRRSIYFYAELYKYITGKECDTSLNPQLFCIKINIKN